MGSKKHDELQVGTPTSIVKLTFFFIKYKLL